MMRPMKQLGKKGKMTKSIVCTYPDFRTLPKGVRQMLVISETLFFDEVQTAAPEKPDSHLSDTKYWWRPPTQFATGGKTALSAQSRR